MVSNASDDLPDPDTPVITVNFSWGMESEMFLRLWTRAPWILIKSSTGILIIRLRQCEPGELSVERRDKRREKQYWSEAAGFAASPGRARLHHCHSRTGVLRELPPRAALRLPRPSAIIAVTRVLRLTPSCSARVTRCECSDFGTRCLHCPLAERPGFGTLSPYFRQLARYDFTASRPFATASSGVSPSVMQPGRSGYSIRYPVPSSSESGRMMKGSSSFTVSPQSPNQRTAQTCERISVEWADLREL